MNFCLLPAIIAVACIGVVSRSTITRPCVCNGRYRPVRLNMDDTTNCVQLSIAIDLKNIQLCAAIATELTMSQLIGAIRLIRAVKRIYRLNALSSAWQLYSS